MFHANLTIDHNNVDKSELNFEERLKQDKKTVYDELDNAQFNIFHVKMIMITCCGFFTVNKLFDIKNYVFDFSNNTFFFI